MNYSDILLAVDFDRTLTATDSTIPQRNLEAIRFFMDQGGAFTINTGRSVPMTNWFRKDVPFNAPLLLYNGSAAWDAATGQWPQAYELDLDPVAFVRDMETRFPELTLEVQGTEAHLAFRKNPRWEAYCEHNLCPWAYVEPDQIPRPLLKLALCGEFRATTVASMYQATEAELARFDEAVSYIEATYGDKVDVFRACARIADIHAKGCSKLASARVLQRQLGKKLLVCVGDGENDLSMMEGADYAWCPSDGVIADRFENVCECGKGAVADVIYDKIPKIPGLHP